MFFSGEASTRKRVDLSGRSIKEKDRQKLLEQTKLERKRRLDFRLQYSAALKIQKFFRGRKVVEAAKFEVRQQFYNTYGNRCERVDRDCFGPNSEFLQQFLFFLNVQQHSSDFLLLVDTCRLLQQFARVSGSISSLFCVDQYGANQTALEGRIKRLAFSCLLAAHHKRDFLKYELLLAAGSSNATAVILLDTVVLLCNLNVPRICKIISYLLQRNSFGLLRDMILTATTNAETQVGPESLSSLEHVLTLLSSHVGQHPCCCLNVDPPNPPMSFSFQIISIPFLWRCFPCLREVFAKNLCGHYLHQMVCCLKGQFNVLRPNTSQEYTGYACMLANILETSVITISQPTCTFDMGMDFATVATFLLEALPPLRLTASQNSMQDEDDMAVDEEAPKEFLSQELERQILNAMDPALLHQLVSVLFRRTSSFDASVRDLSSGADVAAVGAICTFLHVAFNVLPVERILTKLAYRTELVPMLWNYIKRCHENQTWPSFRDSHLYLSDDTLGWVLPLAVFCPIYKYMLTMVDNEEFYEQEKPLSLDEIRSLVIILRQALWQLLWIIPSRTAYSSRSTNNLSEKKKLSVTFVHHRVGISASELLSQLQDWNNRRQFTSPTNFHGQQVINDNFIDQAAIENSRASDILNRAPFLVPFTTRVKIFTSQLSAARERDDHHASSTRHRFRIRRDHIFEDAFNQLSALSEGQLREMIRVTFINEFGAEEAGIDGGGIFKDFMENITRSAFDVQYGLFKETADHLLYPNPGSGFVHEQHLEFFYCLGCLLGKAIFEGILVDIPFASFFLSKLKEKPNYLHDLPSLDPELYRHLLFLKHYKGDLSELELYFVIVNNEYGEQKEEELVMGGKDKRVTNENVITYIHLIANHRLNYQIRAQSRHFLRGFQKLIKKEWIQMFNEHELQILISGSLEGLDVENLRAHTHYNGGYSEGHDVIKMFWQVIRSFSPEYQKKFLKFVTGCSRGPLLGFKYLEPQFCISRTAAGDDMEDLDRLPTSATCMNLLKLPPYKSKEQLVTKIVYAIDADAGFDLS